MSLIDGRGKRVVEPGQFSISIGGGQPGAASVLNGRFNVSGLFLELAER
jgi:beta-glucosidase